MLLRLLIRGDRCFHFAIAQQAVSAIDLESQTARVVARSQLARQNRAREHKTSTN
jgi:hypothetical protein